MTTFDYTPETDVVAPAPPAGKRAILLKMFVQTMWVIVDDETGTVTEHTDGGVTIPASEWPGFYERWASDFFTLQKNVASSRLESSDQV